MGVPKMAVLRKADGAECNINVSDFDPALYTDPAQPAPAEPKAKRRPKSKAKAD